MSSSFNWQLNIFTDFKPVTSCWLDIHEKIFTLSLWHHSREASDVHQTEHVKSRQQNNVKKILSFKKLTLCEKCIFRIFPYSISQIKISTSNPNTEKCGPEIITYLGIWKLFTWWQIILKLRLFGRTRSVNFTDSYN